MGFHFYFLALTFGLCVVCKSDATLCVQFRVQTLGLYLYIVICVVCV